MNGKIFEVSFLGVQLKKKRVTLPAEDYNYTGCKDDDSALMASWWEQAWRNYFHFLNANVHQAYFEEIYLQEHYFPDMVNDLMLTTISVIFFRQHHISLDQMLPTIKFTGERKITTNTKQPLNKGLP